MLMGKKLYKVIRRTTACALAFAMLCGLSGCSAEKEENLLVADVSYPEGYGFDDYDTRREIYRKNSVSDSFVDAVNGFSCDTAYELLKEEGNTCYSPISLYYALAAAAEGAKGQTRDEILELLGESDTDVLSAQCHNLYNILFKDNELGKLLMKGSVWIDDSFEIDSGYTDRLADKYYTESYHGDFASQDMADAMKQWIKDNTGGMDMDIEPDADKVLAILNTVYFSDQWMDKFQKRLTGKDEFRLSDGGTVECEFMNSAYASHYYMKGDGYTRSTLSFKNSGSMYFVLPDEGVDVRSLVDSPEKIHNVLFEGDGKMGEVIWKVPKFSYDTELELNDTLKKLGVTTCFTGDADFSGMGMLKSGENVFVSDIKQNSHIELDENGVTASAFTEIGYAGAALPDGRAEMVLDRPFLYAIVNEKGVIIFIGICDNPAQK